MKLTLITTMLGNLGGLGLGCGGLWRHVERIDLMYWEWIQMKSSKSSI